MWTGIMASGYLVDNKKIEKILKDLRKAYSISENEINGQTQIVIDKKVSLFMRKEKGQSVLSIPYQSRFSYNAWLWMLLIFILLADFTMVGGLLILTLGVLWSYYSYNQYEKLLKVVETTIHENLEV